MSHRVLVCGDRSWDCVDLADRIVERLRLRYGPALTIVHGDAPGIDRAFARAARIRGLPCEGHPAAWDEIDHPAARVRRHPDGRPYDADAGPRRNQLMVDAGAAFCIAVHRDLAGSKGTRDCVQRCLEVGIPVFLIDAEDGQPRRIDAIPGPQPEDFDD